MSSSSFESRVSAALQTGGPTLAGRLISEDESSLVLKAGDALIEVGVGHVVERNAGPGGDIELTLAPDAQLMVSTLVTVDQGFVGSNVFGPLVPGVLADNCNCNCNCGSVENTVRSTEATRLRRPFSGGSRER